MWTLHPEYEKLVTVEYYMTDPQIRRRSWQLRRETYARDPRPNAAHRAIADLASSGAVALRVITQNTDGLHQQAGLPAAHGARTARHVAHGGVHRVRSADPGRRTRSPASTRASRTRRAWTAAGS